MRMFSILAVFAVSNLACGLGGPVAAADVAAVLEKAIAAHGGAGTLGKHKGKAIHSKARGTIREKKDIPFVEEVFLQPPDRSKKVTELEINGTKTLFIMVSNGEKNWLHFGDEVREANANEQAESKEAHNHGDVLNFLKLKERMSDLTSLDEIEVNGRAAVGIEVQTKGHRDMQLFFDKESGMLVKTRTWKKYPMTGKIFAEEKIMSDYQDTDGYKWPRHVVAYRDGKEFLVKEVKEFTLLPQIEDSVFAKP